MTADGLPDIAGLPSVAFDDRSTLRLVSSARIAEPALSPLAGSDEALQFLAAFEQRTSMRRAAELPLPRDLAREELLTAVHGYGWTYINAAFCYTRSTGNRFNDSGRGAWYASWGDGAADTSLAEVGWHLTRELDATGVYENRTDYRELWAGFMATFVDLFGLAGHPVLGPEPAEAYPLGQELARRLRAGGVAGVVYPSVRRAGGQCLAAFRPNLVQEVRPGATWTLEWAGSRTPSVSGG